MYPISTQFPHRRHPSFLLLLKLVAQLWPSGAQASAPISLAIPSPQPSAPPLPSSGNPPALAAHRHSAPPPPASDHLGNRNRNRNRNRRLHGVPPPPHRPMASKMLFSRVGSIRSARAPSNGRFPSCRIATQMTLPAFTPLAL